MEELTEAFLALWQCYQLDERLGAHDLEVVRKVMDRLETVAELKRVEAEMVAEMAQEGK